MSKTKAGIINVTGYAGVELARLLHGHPEVELTSVTGRSAAGQKLGNVFPHLSQSDLTVEAALGEVDVAFSAMPHKESADVILPLLKTGMKVVDISADFRLKDAGDYPRWYGFEHPAPELLPKAVYGLPELYRERALRRLRVQPQSECVGQPGRMRLHEVGTVQVPGRDDPAWRQRRHQVDRPLDLGQWRGADQQARSPQRWR